MSYSTLFDLLYVKHAYLTRHITSYELLSSKFYGLRSQIKGERGLRDIDRKKERERWTKKDRERERGREREREREGGV